MEWSEDAVKELAKAPSFVRNMAKKAVEKAVRQEDRNLVNVEDVKKGRDNFISFSEKKPGDDKKTRIAVVRCEIVSEVCPGIACFKAFNNRRQLFKDYGPDTEMIGFFTCGGCSGRRVSRLVEKLTKYDLDVVHLSSCMMLDDDYPACPHKDEIRKSIESKGVKVVAGTHH
jgi:predicted metal-binding protein